MKTYTMYYIQTHGNEGYLYLKLPGKDEWSRWSIEYAMDAFLEIKESKAQRILTKDLPKEITETYDYGKLFPSIREVYKLN